MRINEMKMRIAAFGLAMLMAVSPFGSAAYVSAAETAEITEKTAADRNVPCRTKRYHQEWKR